MDRIESVLEHRTLMSTLLIAALVATAAAPAGALTPMRPLRAGSPAAISSSTEFLLGSRADRAVAPAALYAAFAKRHKMVPAFSRQTGLSCSSCHYQFPQLTPFGRLFKLNGYTLTGIPTVGEPGEKPGHESLKLLSVPPVAAMLVGSLTQINKTVPGTQNGTVGFPQQFSVFMAGQITPNVGTFTQFTYSAADGSFGIDNVDIRYANHGSLGDRDVIYGVTLHNNPTVQDVWNTVPAWGFPFMASGTVPSPIASTLIDGGLGQQVLGLGAYSLFDHVLYAEFTAYRSALQGAAMPLDTSAKNTTSGVIPYWRVALQHETQSTSLMLGTYGFVAHLFPAGVSGPTNKFTDLAVDAQVEQRSGASTWIGRGSYIHEKQQLDATFLEGGATDPNQTLWTARASVAYLPNLRYSLTLGYFQTSGSTDPILMAPAPVTGSSTGSPNTSGVIGEFNFNAWQNARLGLQYTAYNHFNGSSSAYDVLRGRSASDNNTLYLYTWLAF
jgi:hypothetical protein